MKKIVIAVAALAVLAAPAVAQRRGGGAAQQPSAEDLAKKQQSEALDKQYKDTLKRMNKDGTAARVDPWSNMRDSADATKK
jgi:Ni/Co efflux regulator RcnB